MVIDARHFIKGETKRITLLEEAQATDYALFKQEYTFFKIAPIDSGGIATGTEIEFLLNGRSLVLDNDQTLIMTHPDEDFIWFASPRVGTRRLNLRCADPATADVIFQVTGYAEIAADNDTSERNVTTSAVMEVYGSGMLIAAGDSTPDIGDDTDFGLTDQLVPVTKVYTIVNTGDGNLSALLVTAPTGYTVTVQPAINLGPGDSTTFSVRFDAALVQVYAGDVEIESNLGTFVFAITAEAETP